MNEAGLKERFLVMVNQHIGIIHRMSRLYTNTREDREDLFQEILLNLWKGYPSFRGDSKFSTWLYRIALNTCISGFRKKKKSLDAGPVVVSHNQIPDTGFRKNNDDEILLLYDAIGRLDKLEKAIIILYLEEKSYEEIADVVGITPNHTGVKITRIKEKLRKYLNHVNA